MLTIRRGGLSSVIVLAVIIIVMIAAIFMALNVLHTQLTTSQQQQQVVAKKEMIMNLEKTLNGCANVVTICSVLGITDFAGRYALVIKADPFLWKNQVSLVQIVTDKGTLTLTHEDIRRNGFDILYLGTNSIDISYVMGASGTSACTNAQEDKVVAVYFVNEPMKVKTVSFFIKNVGWVEGSPCYQVGGGGTVVQVQQTTTVYSIGPITIIQGGVIGVTQYLCPPPKQVVGDDYAYVIAYMLQPKFNGTRNNVPTAFLINLRSAIEKAAPPSSPLKLAEDYVYIRNITVSIWTSTPYGIGATSLAQQKLLPFSFTQLNATAPYPVDRSTGVLVFPFKTQQAALSGSLAQSVAVVCLYLGIAKNPYTGSVPPNGSGVLGDVNNDGVTDWKKLSYGCYSVGYDLCYGNDTYHNVTLVLNGVLYKDLQVPIDSTMRTITMKITNPNNIALTDYVVRVKLPDVLKGVPIEILDSTNSQPISFCYEYPNGECGVNAARGDGFIWVKIPYIAPGETKTFIILNGTNGATYPWNVFPYYIDFNNMTLTVLGAKYLPLYPGNAGIAEASVVEDEKAITQMITPSSSSNFTVIAIIRFDGDNNPASEDTVNYGLLTWYGPPWRRTYIYRIFPIVGSMSYSSDEGYYGWALALYGPLPVLYIFKGDTDEVASDAFPAPTTIAAGVRYIIIASYNAETEEGYVNVIPLDNEIGTLPPKPGESWPDDIPWYNVVYNMYSNYDIQDTDILFLSDAGTLTNNWPTYFSGMIYNFTLFNVYMDPTTATNCAKSILTGTLACPAKPIAYLAGSDNQTIYININGTVYPAEHYELASTDGELYQERTGNLSLGVEVDLRLVGKQYPYGADFKLYATPIAYEPDEDNINATLATKAIYLSDGKLFFNDRLIKAYMPNSAWNLMAVKELPYAYAYEVRVGLNGGSYGDFNPNTGGWNILYPFIPVVIADSKAWMKWMMYEDPDDEAMITYVRNSTRENAWRSYFVSISEDTSWTTPSDPTKEYYTIASFSPDVTTATYVIYQQGPPLIGTLYYSGFIDLTLYSIVNNYPQLLPDRVSYIGMGYLIRSDVPDDVNTTRWFDFIFARPTAPKDLGAFVSFEIPEVNSPLIPWPVTFVGMRYVNITAFNWTDVTSLAKAVSLTDSFFLFGNTTTLNVTVYGALANVSKPYYNITSFTNRTVAPLWTNVDEQVLRTFAPMNVSILGNWTIYLWNGTNVALGAIDQYGDFIFYYNTTSAPFGSGLSDGKNMLIVYDTSIKRGLFTNVTSLDGWEVIGINKWNWYVLVNGPICVKC